MKKIILLLVVFGIWSAIGAQETKILRILNRELKKEVKNQFKSPNFNGDTLRIIKPFSIDIHKNLSFAVKITSPYFTGEQIITQQVPLNSVKNWVRISISFWKLRQIQLQLFTLELLTAFPVRSGRKGICFFFTFPMKN
ncbi:hypothetical protein CBW16_03385 [Flavobacteriaceae bacterium JJC]|nr:hypothetical protein CBW16_03385 [Flavobacteriaceae bacterium JJC]